MTSLIRWSTVSGTFGRPSGKRSPVHSDVIATRCSFENMPSCASALPAATLSATARPADFMFISRLPR